MKYFYQICLILFILKNISGRKFFHNCQFDKNFYQLHSNIFELNHNQTSLFIRPLYSLKNQTFSLFNNQTLSIGIIYRFQNTYLVPIPLVFQCLNNNIKEIYSPKDCEFTIIDTHLKTQSESTRIETVSLNFKNYSSLYGAYFKQSTIILKNCRLNTNKNIFILNSFQLQIEFEQIINTKCSEKCLHENLYECNLLSKTCQCRSNIIEKFGQFCIDTELASNCSLTPERCRHICNIKKQISTGQIDEYCQCPIGTKKILFNNIYQCKLPKIIECNQNCPKNFICQNNQCIQISISNRVNQSIFSIPILLICLLIGALIIIIGLIIGLLKMRSIKCVKFIHPENVLSNHHSNNSSPTTITRLSTVHSSSSPCSTLSSSIKSVKLSSTNKILENYRKIDLYE